MGEGGACCYRIYMNQPPVFVGFNTPYVDVLTHKIQTGIVSSILGANGLRQALARGIVFCFKFHD